MRAMTAEDIYSSIIAMVHPDFADQIPLWDIQTVYKLIDLYKERCKTVKELCDTLIALYSPPTEFITEEVAKWLTSDVILHIKDLTQILESMNSFKVDLIKDSIKEFCKERDLKLVTVAQPIRLALVGSTSSPGIFDLLMLVGQQESVSRLHGLLAHVQMQ